MIHQFEHATINIEVSGGTSEMIMANADQVDSIRHNAELPEDANGFDGVTSLDALVVINDLGRNSVRILQPHETVGPNVDVNNDGMVSALDALLVINFLGRQGSGGETESVARSQPAISAPQPPVSAAMLKYAGGAAPVESTGTDRADTDDREELGDDAKSDSLSPLDTSNGPGIRAPSSFDPPEEDFKNKTLPALPDDLDGVIETNLEEPFNGFAV